MGYAHLGYLGHRNLQHVATLVPATGMLYEAPFRLRIGARLGVGYAHAFKDDSVYTFEGGRYVESTDVGQPGLFTQLTTTLGAAVWRGFAVDLAYSGQVQLPANPGIGMGPVPFTALGVVVSYAFEGIVAPGQR